MQRGGIETAGKVSVDLRCTERPRRGSGKRTRSVGSKRPQGRGGRMPLEHLDARAQARDDALSRAVFDGGGRDSEEGAAIPAGGRKRPEPGPTRT